MIQIIAEYEESFSAPIGCGDTMEEAEFLAVEWLGLQDPSFDECPSAITYWTRGPKGFFKLVRAEELWCHDPTRSSR